MKFSIRDLLFVTVIVALAVSWWLDHRRQAQTISEMQTIADQQIRTFYTNDLSAFFTVMPDPQAPTQNQPGK